MCESRAKAMVLAEHAVTKEGARASASLSRKLGSIIPCLPDDLALCILARVPRSLQPRCKLVCHSWRAAMEPARMTSIRKALNISEAWPVFFSVMYNKIEVMFTIIEPVRHRCRNIPLPSQFHECHVHFDFSVMGALGSKVFIAAIASSFKSARHERRMQGVYSFDVLSMKWQDLMYAPLPTTLTPSLFKSSAFAVDMDGGYVYVAGGYGWRGGKTIQGAERLNIETKRWETLPDPHVKRNSAVAVVMGGLFYVIGGYSDSMFKVAMSGEIWDPVTQAWTLVPELCPREVFEVRFDRRTVVALGDRLYALRPLGVTDEVLAEELMYYEFVSKRWMSLGFVPLDTKHYPLDVHLLTMGEELWVIHLWKFMGVATKPTLSHHPLSWRTVPGFFMRGRPRYCGPPVYCGRMVGELCV